MPPLLPPSPASAGQPATASRMIRGCPRRRKRPVADGGRTHWPRFGTTRLCRSLSRLLAFCGARRDPATPSRDHHRHSAHAGTAHAHVAGGVVSVTDLGRAGAGVTAARAGPPGLEILGDIAG